MESSNAGRHAGGGLQPPGKWGKRPLHEETPTVYELRLIKGALFAMLALQVVGLIVALAA